MTSYLLILPKCVQCNICSSRNIYKHACNFFIPPEVFNFANFDQSRSVCIMACNLKKPLCCLGISVWLLVWIFLWIFTLHSLYKKDFEGCSIFACWLFVSIEILLGLSWEKEFCKKHNLEKYFVWFIYLTYGSMYFIGNAIAIILLVAFPDYHTTKWFVLAIQIVLTIIISRHVWSKWRRQSQLKEAGGPVIIYSFSSTTKILNPGLPNN